MSANNVFYKPSFTISSIFDESLSEDNERFLLFIKGYYEWLQTSEVTISNKTGTFIRDETITGSTTNSKAIVKEIKTSSIVIRMLTNAPFDILETITGANSSATATISSIKDNVVRKTGQLLNYRDATKTVDKYVDFLKQELYQTLPQNIEANKRLVARKYKDFLQNKGNEESYKFIFRTIYDENIEIRYPGEDILRVSDGKFEKTQIIRAVIEDESTIFNYLNQTITGKDSGAIANVVNIKLINVGSIRVAEMTLKLVSGVFNADERIEIVGTETTNTAIYGMVTGFIINDAGSGYSIGDAVTITSNTGQQAVATVSSIEASPITAIKVNAPGYGYRLNTNATITNTGTGGSGLVIRVTEIANTYTVDGYTVGETATISIVGRGSGYFSAPTITLTDTTISSLGLLSENLITIANTGNNYAVGDTLVFTGGAGSNAAGQIASVNETTTYDLLFEDGFRMKADGSYYDIIKNEDWSVTGGITRLELTNFGTGYTSANLPSITITTSGGSGANLIATGIQGAGANVSVDIANNSAGIGAIRKIEISNFGVGYESANAVLTSVGDGNANVTPIISGLGISDGNWINDDGKVDYKILQDSYFYQDFSYVIRSGLAFNEYSNIIKDLIHPAGLQFFGEILLTSQINVAPNFTSVIETVGNINEYIYYIILNINASSPGIVGNINTLVYLEKLIETQTSLYAALERLITLRPEIDVSPLIKSTVSIIENINEYIVYIESAFSVTTTPEISSVKAITFEKLIETQTSLYAALERLVTFRYEMDVSPLIKSAISIIETINQYIVYIESAFSVTTTPEISSVKTITTPTFADVHLGATVPYYYYDETIGEYQSIAISEFASTPMNTFIEYIQIDVPIQFVVTLPSKTIYLPPVSATNKSSEFNLILESSLSPTLSTEVINEVKLDKLLDVSPSFNSSNILISKSTNLFYEAITKDSNYNVSIKSLLNSNTNVDLINDIHLYSFGNASTSLADVNVSSLGQQQITSFSSETINSYANSTFNQEYLTTVTTYNKIVGTVSISGNIVVGSGTTFTSDFFVGSDFVVGSEKFLVSNISNSTYMTLNVIADTNYTNVSAYK
jgi:hypothetical protein